MPISMDEMYGGKAPEGAGAVPTPRATGTKSALSVEEFTGKPQGTKQKEETSMFQDVLSAQAGMAEHLVAFWDKAAVGLNEATKNAFGVDLNKLGERAGFMSTKQVAERAQLLTEEAKKNEPKTVVGGLSTLPAYMATLYPQIVMAGSDMYEKLTAQGVDKKTATKAAAAATTTSILGIVVPYGRGLVAGAASGAGISVGTLLGENKFMQYLLSGNYPKIAEEYKVDKEGIIQSGTFGLALGGIVGKLTGKSLKTPEAKKAVDLFADMAQEDEKSAEAVVRSTEKVDPKLAKELQTRIDEMTVSKKQVTEMFTTVKKDSMAHARGEVTETDVKKIFDQSKRIATPETSKSPEQAVAETRNVMRAGYEATEVQSLPPVKKTVGTTGQAIATMSAQARLLGEEAKAKGYSTSAEYIAAEPESFKRFMESWKAAEARGIKGPKKQAGALMPKARLLEAMAEGMGSGIEHRTGERKIGSQLDKLTEATKHFVEVPGKGLVGQKFGQRGAIGNLYAHTFEAAVELSDRYAGSEVLRKTDKGWLVSAPMSYEEVMKLPPADRVNIEGERAEGFPSWAKKQRGAMGDLTREERVQVAKVAAKNAVRAELAAGRITPNHSYRDGSLEELQYIAKNKMLMLGKDREGNAGISAATVHDGNFPVHHEGFGYIVPPEALETPPGAAEVSVNPKADPTKMKYVVAGKVLTFEQMQQAVQNPQIVKMFSGITVTKEDIQRTFQLAKEHLPILATWEKELKDSYEVAMRWFAPESIGPEAKRAAAITARAVARQAQADSAETKAAEARRAFWQSRGDDANLQFLYDFERGKPIADPVLEAARKGYEREFAKINAFDEATGVKYEARDNYLYHLFEDCEGVAKFFSRRYGPQWSSPKFTKQRGFELYRQAVEAGFKPRFTNPEDILLARQHASNLAAMRTETLEGMERLGLGRKAVKGQRPEFGETEWTAPTKQKYWVHDDASQILHNAFDTPSLWTLKGPVGSSFRGAMGLKNTLVPLKLAISAFHLLHVATIDTFTGMVRASKGLLAGSTSPGAWAKSMLRGVTFADTFKNPRAGGELMRLWGKDASKLTDAERTTLQYMFDGGFIPEMSSQWKIGALKNFQDAVEAGNTIGAIARAPMAAVEAIQRPMFEVWIPRLKANAYIQDIKTAMEVNPELVHNEKMRIEAFRKIAKSVDNRYGEMAYNTLFMNRIVKDGLVASSLSMGWWLGFLREYGGAGIDIGKVISSRTGLATAAKQGDLDRALFVSLYTTGSLLLGGLLTYGMSGQTPQGWKDYVYPKSGGKNPDGTDKRVSTMFYTREFGGIALHAQEEGLMKGISQHIANKASPVIGTANALWTNLDYFGNEISDPSSGSFQQLQQKLTFAFKEMEPIAIGAARKGGTVEERVLPFLGLNPAPGYANETPAEAQIKTMFHKYHSQVTPYAQAQLNAQRRDLGALYRAGDVQGYQQKLKEIQEEHHLTSAQVQKIRQGLAGRGTRDAAVSMFKQLSAEEQLKILKTMTPEERAKYLRVAHTEARRALQ